jgi:hypothetical protein
MQDMEKWKPEGGVDLSRDREQPAIKLYPSMEPYREPITSSALRWLSRGTPSRLRRREAVLPERQRFGRRLKLSHIRKSWG